MRSPVILILTFLTWFSYGTIIQSGAHAQGLVITSPRNGAVLPMQQQSRRSSSHLWIWCSRAFRRASRQPEVLPILSSPKGICGLFHRPTGCVPRGMSPKLCRAIM
jgi:hypothetical protein